MRCQQEKRNKNNIFLRCQLERRNKNNIFWYCLRGKEKQNTMRRRALIIILIWATLGTISCRDARVPRPRGYFRITLPEPEYVAFDSIGVPYSFERSSLALIEPDNDENAEPYWINIYYPTLNCRVHVTYRDIRRNADEALEDSRRLAYKHTVKADAIGESYFDDDIRGVHGTLYRIKGNAATPLQFALTDSVRHMFRGSLYFYCRPNKDSLSPVVGYLEDDIAHMIETFSWRN